MRLLPIATAALAALSTLACGGPPSDPGPGAAVPLRAAVPPRGADPLAAVTLPDLDTWTDKYHDPEDPKRFFDLPALMRAHGLSRLQAVEVQNHFRDLARAHHGQHGNPGDIEAHFKAALDRARSGQFQSGLDPARLAAARFIVVFDLDETLLQQGDHRYVPDDCRDFTYTEPGPDGRPAPRNVKLNPAWQTTFERVRALGGHIALFSANVDARTETVLRAWQWEGKPVIEHPDIAGWLSNSHLTQSPFVRDPKNAAGQYDRAAHPDGPQRPPRPIVEPSKDLRLFDESLSRVILVDDNPLRVSQYRNLRWFPKFRATAVCGADETRRTQAAQGLERVTAELTEAVGWLDAHPEATFAQAFLPYTLNGAHAVKALVELNQLTHDQAVAAVRAQPDLVEEDF